ncbi:LamG-like jellyroll fold domain-containing protein [Sinomonas sp. JGH33]|uniref:LamG-like jellyroll fold domain-containing protein n=1 Tax=Sinomonas terricola TaxID=3110330 RepID=A0ABU5T663_9MICC|nr:LamG-like jellyroll fold domain-containing protein [Sinomonas sp. JGH33]MEA5455152.1 LamG-like jellyroll fold domain-containing protein [Sinomonas sp. JGH33]
MGIPGRRPRRLSRRAIALLLGLGLMCAALGVPLAFWAEGGRWFDVTTPSMGQHAPVGSLVLTRPVAALGDLRAGDVVAYREAETGRTIVHRVVSIAAESATTRGDINGSADPQPVRLGQILGREVAVVDGGGWAARGVPILAAASIVVALVGLRVGDRLARRACWVAGESLAVAATLLVLRPLVGVQEVLRMPEGDGLAMTFVSTGILPIRVSSESGAFVDLAEGQVGTVHSTARHADGSFVFVPSARVDWLGWAVMAAVVLAPLVLMLVWAGRDAARSTAQGGPGAPVQVPALTSAGVVLVLVPALACLPAIEPRAGADFRATLADSANSAGSRTFFTCRAAAQGTASPLVAYAMGTSGSTESDLSGHAYTGAYSTWVTGLIMVSASVTPTASHGCQRDTPSASVPFGGLLPLCLDTPDASVQTNPSVFSIEAWFSTTATSNGKIIGFSSSHGIGGAQADRHIYIDPAGRLVFGVNPGTAQIASSPAGTSYADGRWHHVVATLSAAGMMLYADGALVGSNAGTTSAQPTTGYWEVGCGPTANLLTAGGLASFLLPSFFTGSLQYAAVYSTALSAAQVTEHYLAGAP